MEREDANFTRLKAQVTASMLELERLAGHKIELVKREVINGLEHRTKELNRTIEELVLEPVASICQELLTEFPAEFAAKKKFLAGCEDGIITGGITDDWRIYRYMHASHSVLHNNLPSRWAGNRVFPNGFIEMELKRGKKLVIFGEPDITDQFTLTIDEKSIIAQFDSDGTCQVELPPTSNSVKVRLEKYGMQYPVFYAVVTRNDY